ncbi:MAG: iron(III) transport system permease protein [Methylobacteriaceae bacterium]|nr:iron(III) transport system permease protein [Methylobacteriaceae bacterium]
MRAEGSSAAAVRLPGTRHARLPGRFDPSALVFVLCAIILLTLVGLPLFWLAVSALTDKTGAPSLANFERLFTDPTLLAPLQISLIVATSVGCLATIIAAPIAWIVARSDMPARRLIRALITASFVTPPFLGAIAWEVLAAPNSGLINGWYRALYDLPPFVHFIDIYSIEGLIFVDSCYAFPFVFVLVANALDRIPADMEDAAAILGAPAWRIIFTITLPLALPAILAGALIAFLRSLTLFGTPAILALPAGFHTITTKIWSLFQYPPNPGLAAAASVPLLLATVVLLKAQSWILGRRGYVVLGGRSSLTRGVELGAWRWAALLLCLLVLCFPVFLPYFALLKAALTTTLAEPLSRENLTLQHVRFVFFEFSPTRLALRNTLLFAFVSAVLGTGLAVVVSYLVSRKAVFGHSVLGFLATAPTAVPGIVLGVGMFIAYTRGPVVLYGTIWVMIIAYVTIELPGAYQQLKSAFTGVAHELEEAGRILGAGRLRTLRDITAPLLRTGVIAAWCFIFIGVMRELSAAIMLFTAETKVLPVVIYDLNESGNLGAISVLGLMLLVLTFAITLLANRMPGFGAATSGTK